MLIAQAQRSAADAYAAQVEPTLTPRQWAIQALGSGYTAERYPQVFALFDAVNTEMITVITAVKTRGPQRLRPHQRDPRVEPALPREAYAPNAWPSTRAFASRVWTGVLADLFPERAAALAEAADRTAMLRVIGGVHYPTDIVAGRLPADAYLSELREHPEYRDRLAAARSAGPD